MKIGGVYKKLTFCLNFYNNLKFLVAVWSQSAAEGLVAGEVCL
jgi:hypothetical protein